MIPPGDAVAEIVNVLETDSSPVKTMAVLQITGPGDLRWCWYASWNYPHGVF